MNKREKRRGVLDTRFQANLRQFRVEKGWKQADLAEAMEWGNDSYVSQLENGYRGFSSELVEALAKKFGKDPGDFFKPIE